jgi:hypothetical protein
LAKTSGLGDNFYLSGYDLSGDIGSLEQIRGGPKTQDVTGLDKSAFERIGLLRDGQIDFMSFFNTAVGQQHAALKVLPTTDVIACYFRGTTLGNPAAGINAKQVNYDPARGQDGSLTFKTQCMGQGYALEWGVMLSAGKVTVASSGSLTGVDGGLQGLALTISGNSAANPTVITTSVAHGLVTGDSVSISGSNSTPSIDGDWPVTVLSGTTFSIPVNVSVAGTAGTATKTSTNYGAAAYLQVFSVASGTVTPKIQHSADNGVADTWADVTGLTFTNATARTSERLQAATTATIKRYVRFTTTNTFTNAVLAVLLARYLSTP